MNSFIKTDQRKEILSDILDQNDPFLLMTPMTPLIWTMDDIIYNVVHRESNFIHVASFFHGFLTQLEILKNAEKNCEIKCKYKTEDKL